MGVHVDSHVFDKLVSYMEEYQLLLMEACSEGYYAAGWMSGLEEMMWDGSLSSTPEAIKCRDIAKFTGIWWENNPDSSGEEPWRIKVPMRDWKKRMDSRKEAGV